MNSPILVALDFYNQYKLYVDASDELWKFFMQENEDGIAHPVGYFSQKFNKHQAIEECLGLILALNYFEVYLYTTYHPILVYTNHNPLTFIHIMWNKCQRLMRWGFALQQLNMYINNVTGCKNVVADASPRC